MNKQYLMLCDEDARLQLEKVFKNVEFLEVQGVNLNAENKFNILVTPVIPPVNPVMMLPEITQPGEQPQLDESVQEHRILLLWFVVVPRACVWVFVYPGRV